MDAAVFARERAYLVRVAYRLTGSVAAAEDCVQEAWLRAHTRDDLDAPRAFLTTVVTRVALDAMRAERRRRRAYDGPWLPEPLGTDGEDPDRHDSLSLAFLVLLESLRPRERAVFVLHEVLDVPMPEVAKAVDRREDACRQLLRRARARWPRAGPGGDPLAGDARHREPTLSRPRDGGPRRPLRPAHR